MSQEKAAEIIDLTASRAPSAGGDGVGEEAAGAFLAASRRAHRLSLENVSDATKIKTDHLRALESGNYDALPAAPYAVGFVKVYAAYLGLDAGGVAAQFKREMAAAMAGAAGLASASAAADEAPLRGPATIGPYLGIAAVIAFVLWVAVQIIATGGADRAASDRREPQVRITAANAPAPRPAAQGRVTEAPTAEVDESRTIEPAAETAPGTELTPDGGAMTVAPAPLKSLESRVVPLTQPDTAPPPMADPAPRADAFNEAEAALLKNDARADFAPTVSRDAAQPSQMPSAQSATQDALGAPPATANPAPRMQQPQRQTPRATEQSAARLAAAPAPAIIDSRITRTRAPTYPNACGRGAAALEQVTVLFDVTAKGRTTNVRASSSSNDCFEAAAVKAVQKWRYDPRTVDGAPRPDLGKKAIVNFQR